METSFKLLNPGTGCAGGKCPSIYLGSDGYVYIKGTVVDAETRTALEAESTEDVVRIPFDVLKGSAADIKS